MCTIHSLGLVLAHLSHQVHSCCIPHVSGHQASPLGEALEAAHGTMVGPVLHGIGSYAAVEGGMNHLSPRDGSPVALAEMRDCITINYTKRPPCVHKSTLEKLLLLLGVYYYFSAVELSQY
ncbi:hypothetical protein AMECASPLE_039390 [Ameca splendens]|uniref:Uncharacterized protein n=1 Tax=Ameca splendens TaxID=208324 RepID=A0ABV0XLI1_9TELE